MALLQKILCEPGCSFTICILYPENGFFFFSFTIFLCLFVFLFPKIIFSDSEGGTCKLNSTMVVFKHINCLGKVSTAHSHSALLVIFHDSVYFFIIFLILFSKLKSIIFIFCLYI